jgi:(1->4)-alpha-D-glucan 1-alpha-D-glucosylmutase
MAEAYDVGAETALDALSRLYGVVAEYKDIWGKPQRASDDTRHALLKALGALDDHADLEEALRAKAIARWRTILPCVAVFRVDAVPYRLRLHFRQRDEHATYRWNFALENGQTLTGEFRPSDLEVLDRRDIDGEPYIEVAFDWRSALPTGYHRYSLTGPGLTDDWLSFIVGPERCYLPAAVAAGTRVWGAAVQLYSVRSDRNWGMGDFTDLRSVVEQWGRRGAGLMGVNPLHALYPHNPAHASPYSPSSRLFLNVLYIDVEALPDARESAEVLAAMASARFQTDLQAARAAELVDYPAVAALKWPLLAAAYAHFREHHLGGESERGWAFRRFQAEGGERLRRHALFEALQEHFQRQDPALWGWPVWPEAFRRPDAPEVTAFAQAHVERVEFYEYLQWQAGLQLDSVGARADALGYAVGVYQDLAISIDRGGAESWANQEVYAVGASVGAPPDEVNLKGQNWGLPPLRPEAVRAARYEPFIATLRANMCHSGALRIDHVMGLYRLYWIPPGASAAEGAYVCYPFEDLLTILALESHRNQCMVIGEDLGTVPDEVRIGLARALVMSYRLFMFERNEEGDYKKPAEYPVDALVAASTHDLATLTGFWEGHDLEVRHKLNLFPSEELRRQYVLNRAVEKARLVPALEGEKLLPEGEVNPVSSPMTPELTLALHAYLAHTPSRLLVVQPEDVLGVIEQANMPGTVEEHPNWRRKLPLTLEEIERDPRFISTTETLARIRPAPKSRNGGGGGAGRRTATIPRCTYRLQLNADFRFTDATALIPYLERLGVSHVYCSPYLRARTGSRHGYDIIDHNALNPEIGTQQDFERFVETLREHGMGHILDMVPNHMGVLGADNAWWLDVLENGPASTYADFFDIEWHPVNPALQNKVLIPVLGDQYGLVLERGELNLRFKADVGEFSVCYYDHRFPIDPRQYPRILEIALSRLAPGEIPHHASAELATLCAAFRNLPGREEPSGERRAERQRDKDVHKRQLARLSTEQPAIGRAIQHALQAFSDGGHDRAAHERLHELLENQAYRLSSWRVAADEINYRRFFDINELAALRMENENTFEATHRFVLALAASGKIAGLRIDHPDGLFDPDQYFQRLQQRYAQLAGVELVPGEDGRPPRPLYVVIEKIAATHEKLPETWAVYGTSGYRYAVLVNGVLVDTDAGDEMERVYRGFAEDAPHYEEAVYEGKRTIMDAALASPLAMLTTELLRIAHADRRTRDYTFNNLRNALAEVVACFPVYRTYIVDTPSTQDRRYIEWAVAQARRRSRAADTTVFEFVRRMLLAEASADASPQLKHEIKAFAMKMQQFTSPVTAKGIEDTAFYRYNRLVSLNDVGGDPDQFGVTVAAYHGASAERGAHRPHTMLATSTHDNKRSEDVRARIDVLSEMPGEWRKLLRRWERMNRSKKTEVENLVAPSSNDEYLLYQILLGSFPLEDGDDAMQSYSERIEAYMLKAIREAKVHTSWINPLEPYEASVSAFVKALLAPSTRNLFLKDLRAQAKTLAWYGMLNSLSMTLLKLTSPGVPDIYQGNETCDYSLVDPDNRRPVDYAAREQMLESLAALAKRPQLASAAHALAASALDGRAKMWLIWRTLELRRGQPDVFCFGQYVPLHAHGAQANHVVAFMRRHGGKAMITIAGRLWMKLGAGVEIVPTGKQVWADTAIDAGPLSGTLVNVFTGENVTVEDGKIRLAAAFSRFPGALLVPAR